jgi:hypothetical protein
LCELAESAVREAEAGGHGLRRSHPACHRARSHSVEAARMARDASDAQWEINVLLRACDVLERCGAREDALALQFRALGLISGHAAFA